MAPVEVVVVGNSIWGLVSISVWLSSDVLVVAGDIMKYIARQVRTTATMWTGCDVLVKILQRAREKNKIMIANLVTLFC